MTIGGPASLQRRTSLISCVISTAICLLPALAVCQTHAVPSPTEQLPEQTNPRCGLFCLYISLQALDVPADSLEDLERRLGPPGPRGYSLGELQALAQDYGLHTLGVRTSLENLRRRPERFACIAHVQGGHFVNIADVDDEYVYVVDPPHEQKYRHEVFNLFWEGDALLLAPDPLTVEASLPPLNTTSPSTPLWGALIIAVVLVAMAVFILRRRRTQCS